MGTASKSYDNHRCTHRGSLKASGPKLDESISTLSGQRVSNHQGRRDAWKRVRLATKWVMKHVAPEDYTETHSLLVRRFGAAVNQIHHILYVPGYAYGLNPLTPTVPTEWKEV